MTTQGQVIVGTAGHIDHGKTSLVRVLTGVDCDRLPEEKERGITIELGFAPLVLPSGVRLGLVDVPGHERFVRAMVAGAAGIDLVMLVIAADEGIMPQTREHLDICQLLGTRGGVVVLTKADLVDAEWLELVTGEVRSFLAGTFLEGAPVIPFSAADGRGREELLAALTQAVKGVPPRPAEGIFRLPVDRVFTIRGFGTVVTGTLLSGRVRAGEEVQFYPGEVRGKVRGVQVHADTVEEAGAGMRTALNLQGLEKETIERGQVVARPGSLLPSFLLDAKVRLLPSAPWPLADRTRLRVDLFTSEAMARAVPLAAERLEPGEEGVVQLRLESPVVALPGDRFVLRSESPMRTVGGGVVLDPFPAKRKRGRPGVAGHLARLETAREGGEPGERLLALLEEPGSFGVPSGTLAVRAGVSPERAERVLGGMVKAGKAVTVSGLAYSARAYQSLRERLLAVLADFHQANPARTGMNREELRQRLSPDFPVESFRVLLEDLSARGAVQVEKEEVRGGAHEATLTPGQQELGRKVLSLLASSGFTPPFLDEMAATFVAPVPQVKAVLTLLAQRGEAVRIKDDFYLAPPAHGDLLARVDGWFDKKTEMAMADFRELTGGATRKWLIPLFEYLDRSGVTLRKGDLRIRRGKAAGAGAPAEGVAP